MAEYIKIDHIDQLYAMPPSRQEAFKAQVRDAVKAHPFRHIDTEWGRFNGLRAGPTEARRMAEALVKTMTTEQKVNQMSADYTPAQSECAFERYNCAPYYAGEDPALNIPAIKFTDGPTGVVLGYGSTAFPVSMARAASFDPELEEEIGEAIGVEGRAQGANLFGGVCVNLLRHPGWGRAQETYGEDPYLLGEMGSALIRGVQKHMMACVKHFCANSMENSRFLVDVRMSERTLREVYLPHFRRCVQAGAAAVMSAYNRFRGEWCGHNAYLLRHVLKEEWGFQGFVMSDFGYGIRGTVEPANAGLDLEMNNTQFYGRRLTEAVRDGLVPERTVDEAAVRILAKKIEYAGIGGDQTEYPPDRVACPKHIGLARRAAQESMVLLKNNGVLPLSPERCRRLLIVGDLAKTGDIGDSKGSSAVFPPYVTDVLTGIRRAAAGDTKVDFARGVVADEVRSRAAGADAVVVCAGLTHLDEGEYFEDSRGTHVGGDRKHLGLPEQQLDMIAAACEGNPNTIVVLQGGSVVDVTPFKDRAAAVLITWYPGMEGGGALADILFGRANPSGKLPVSIYQYEQDLPYFDLQVESIRYGFYHGYFAADRYGCKVCYPFGFGLSYTRFTLSDVQAWRDDGAINAEATLTNAGPYEGAEVVQLYVGYRGSGVERHIKDLKGFRRVSLKPGETMKVSFTVKTADLAYYDEQKQDWVEENIGYEIYLGTSSACEDLTRVEV